MEDLVYEKQNHETSFTFEYEIESEKIIFTLTKFVKEHTGHTWHVCLSKGIIVTNSTSVAAIYFPDASLYSILFTTMDDSVENSNLM